VSNFNLLVQDRNAVNDKQDHNTSGLGAKAFTGAALMVATRFAVRLLGLISVTVLARLLTPADFGLFGTAALILGFFILLKEVGFGEAVIKEKDLTKDDIDTLWTMRAILSALTGLILFLVSPIVAEFLKDDRVTPVLQVMSFIPIIDALASPASALLLRELKYGADFLLKSGNKIIRVAAVITVALILRSYWALVFGALLSSVLGVIVTHIVRPYRPKLTLKKLDKHVGFAAWTYMRGIAFYIANSSDEFVVRSSASTAFFGIYHIARDLARVLISELIGPVREAMLPALARLQHDRSRHAAAASNIFGAALIVGVALSVGAAATAQELVLILLGNQWVAAAPFLSLLAIGCAANAIGEVNQSSFITAGLQKKSVLFWVLRAAVYSVGCTIAGLFYNPTAIAVTFSAASVIILTLETVVLLRLLDGNITILQMMIRPLIAGGLMAAAVFSLPIPVSWPIIAVLFAKVVCGSVVYGLVIAGLWKITGYQDGPEYALYKNLPAKIQKLIPLNIPQRG